MSDVVDLQKKALQVRQQYDDLNLREGRETWSGLDYTTGLAGDLGSLVKAVMTAEGKRSGSSSAEHIGHHLGDCLWSLFVIADAYHIDIEDAFHHTMSELEERLAA